MTWSLNVNEDNDASLNFINCQIINDISEKLYDHHIVCNISKTFMIDDKLLYESRWFQATIGDTFVNILESTVDIHLPFKTNIICQSKRRLFS